MEYMDGGSLDLVGLLFCPEIDFIFKGDKKGGQDRGEVLEKNNLRCAKGLELPERKTSDYPQVVQTHLT